ncbi:unnamed protein product, partial [Polarella glacialis]
AGQMSGQEEQMSQMAEKQEKMKNQEEQKRVMVRQILEPEALERLNRVGLVKPEKRQQVEMALLNIAQSGQLTEKISDASLVQLIEKVSGMSASASTVTIQRKRRDDSDDDIDLDNL